MELPSSPEPFAISGNQWHSVALSGATVFPGAVCNQWHSVALSGATVFLGAVGTQWHSVAFSGATVFLGAVGAALRPKALDERRNHRGNGEIAAGRQPDENKGCGDEPETMRMSAITQRPIDSDHLWGREGAVVSTCMQIDSAR